ncbi:PAS domain-containing protein [Algoriphagus sp.]|uniref:PAS domain-containing protein n=1 Tax=Algoriphagus sp. TaxID=1872435 RepID=UPI002608D9F9|nr:PAS domain-containing protein [Algoriphagus sp.]
MIKVQNSEQLLPDFLMESSHFYFALLDVEGLLLDANDLLLNKSNLKLNDNFFSGLDQESSVDFSELLDQMISRPQDARNIVLNFPVGDKSHSVWWEFSMVLNSEMDIVGLVGLGVSLKFLEQELPWERMAEILHFGKIEIDSEFKIKHLDKKVIKWLDSSSDTFLNQSILNSTTFAFTPSEQEKIQNLEINDQPLFLKIPAQFPNRVALAGLLSKHSNGFTFLLSPSKRIHKSQPSIAPFSASQLAAIQGAVWVVDRQFTIVQQNQAAVDFSKNIDLDELKTGTPFSSQWAGKRQDQVNKAIVQAFEGNERTVDVRIDFKKDISFWNVRTSPILDDYGQTEGILIQVIDVTKFYSRIRQLEVETHELKELALKPSHILRSPLSSMLGLLDLIDHHKLDEENKKYFSYLKPLAQELDEVIRSNAKKMASLD